MLIGFSHFQPHFTSTLYACRSFTFTSTFYAYRISTFTTTFLAYRIFTFASTFYAYGNFHIHKHILRWQNFHIYNHILHPHFTLFLSKYFMTSVLQELQHPFIVCTFSCALSMHHSSKECLFTLQPPVGILKQVRSSY